jgi:hypothetical protein
VASVFERVLMNGPTVMVRLRDGLVSGELLDEVDERPRTGAP